MGGFETRWLLALASLAVVACSDDAAKDKKSEIRISGPVGTEYSTRPVFEGTGRERIAGCCSFTTGKAKVRKLEGDLDGRKILGEGFHTTLSFGPGAISAQVAPGGSKSAIDGIDLLKHVAEKPAAQDPTFVYTAVVPLNEEATAKKIDPPELEVLGWCDNARTCDELKQILDSLRF